MSEVTGIIYVVISKFYVILLVYTCFTEHITTNIQGQEEQRLLSCIRHYNLACTPMGVKKTFPLKRRLFP